MYHMNGTEGRKGCSKRGQCRSAKRHKSVTSRETATSLGNEPSKTVENKKTHGKQTAFAAKSMATSSAERQKGHSGRKNNVEQSLPVLSTSIEVTFN